MLRRTKFYIMLAGFSILSFAFTLRVAAITPSNTECWPSGGCSFPCLSASGASEQVISASQLTQCSPAYGSDCTPNSSATFGICGWLYYYSAPECNAANIDGALPYFSYYCSAN